MKDAMFRGAMQYLYKQRTISISTLTDGKKKKRDINYKLLEFKATSSKE